MMKIYLISSAMKKMKLNRKKMIPITIVFVIFIIYGAISNLRARKMEARRITNAKYVVGIAVDRYKNIRSYLPTIEYAYSINKGKYSQTQSFNPDKYPVVIGERYWVEFDSGRPDNSKILLDRLVPQNILLAFPTEMVWDSIPSESKVK